MALDRDTIRSFIFGEPLPSEVVDEIERTLDDPNSEACRMAREFARLTRLALDPEGPPPGERFVSDRGKPLAEQARLSTAEGASTARSLPWEEIDSLIALWMAEAETEKRGDGTSGISLSEVHARVGAVRAGLGRPSVKKGTVAAALRGSMARGVVGTLMMERGARTSGTRASDTGYRTLLSPAQVFGADFEEFARAYSPAERGQALLDYARRIADSEG
jgi:hypothetical protein